MSYISTYLLFPGTLVAILRYLSSGVSTVPQGTHQCLTRSRVGPDQLYLDARLSFQAIVVPIFLCGLLPGNKNKAPIALVVEDDPNIVVVLCRVHVQSSRILVARERVITDQQSRVRVQALINFSALRVS